MKTIVCDKTGEILEVKETAKGNPKLPKGWKWIGGKAVSAKAFSESYFLSAVEVKVVSPNFDGNAYQMKQAWIILDEQLRIAWQKSTEAANWAAKQLWANDVLRTHGEVKCPKMPPIYLYGLRDWTGWAASAGAVLRTVESSYRKKRYEIIWTGSAGVPFVRYPYPYPVHNATWNLTQLDGGAIVFDARLPSGRASVKVRTKDKSGKYTLGRLKHLIDNPDLRGEAAILKRKDGSICIKLVGYFPKTIRESAGSLIVRTSPINLLTLFNEKSEKLLVINGDWIKRKIAGHEASLSRWRDDQKMEYRVPKRRSRKNAEDMKLACEKIHNRLKSFIGQTVASIVGYAIRNRLAIIRYDDSEKGYFLSFPWHRFAETISSVCNREGIAFERLSASQNTTTARKSRKSGAVTT